MIELYAKKNCNACAEAKNLMDNRGILYTIYTLDEQITKEQLLAKFPDVRTVPVIVVDGRRIGGLNDFKMFLESTSYDQKSLLLE